MDGLILLAGLFVVGLPLAVIYLLISHVNLKRSVAGLEQRVRDLQGRAGTSPTTQVERIPPAQVTPEPEPQQVREIVEPAPKPPKAATAADVIAARRENVAASLTQNSDYSSLAEKAPTGPTLFDRLVAWIAENWFYAVSALSLALAGLFLVQYGMENGFLPPAARVASAFGFGAALIGAGEFIRRKFGDGEDSTTAYLPSVFAGAGIVSLFGSVLSAQMLYGLIGGNTALIGMIVVAGVAIVLGWFYGSLLAAIGVIGAFGAPLVLGGNDSDPTPLFGYFALVTAVGLGIDTLRRWAWVSGLTVALAFVMGTLLSFDGQIPQGVFQIYILAVVVMAILIPARGFMPDHNGAMLFEWLGTKLKGERPIFPVFLAWATTFVGALVLVGMSGEGEISFWVSIVALAGLSAALVIWSLGARALQDLALLPMAGMLVSISSQSRWTGVRRAFAETHEIVAETPYPMAVTALFGGALLLSALAAWRSLSKGAYPVIWALVAAVFAPSVAITLEMVWAPAKVIAPYIWALHGAVLAAFMVFWAERFAKADGAEQRLRMSFFVLAALASISFALVIILTSAALTVALAITVLGAAALDRRFDLPAMTVFISVGVVTLGYRLIADPGLDWGMRDASWPELFLAYGGVLAAFVASLWLLRDKDRPSAKIMLDSAAWSAGGVLASLVVFRAITAATGTAGDASHWSMGIYATIWATLALTQVQRLEIEAGALMRQLRIVFGAIFAMIGIAAIVGAAVLFSPLLSTAAAPVSGPPVFNTLAVAYLLPALVLCLGWLRITTIPTLLRLAMQGLSGALIALWTFSALRHFWQGSAGMPLAQGMSEPELYSYTIALLILGAGLFYQSMAVASPMLRKAGLVVIAAAVAKVFFVDISDLDGLTRVFSLLALGLSLAGLAWLNKWAQSKDQAPETPNDG